MTQGHSYQYWTLGIASSLAIAGAITFYKSCALAQIKPDATLGAESSVIKRNLVIRNLSSDRIDGGARRGANLFHSFREFNIDEEQGAYFANPNGIKNILSRVTGNGRSDIQGELGVLGNANLFLINPDGIIFGPNAKLDLKGSFLATTASSLIFDDDKQFSTINPEAPPLLTVDTPLGLQFEGTAGSILTQSGQPNLEVQLGQTLALVGGEITMQGGLLTAPEGRIELGSVAGTGQVSLIPVEEGGWALGYKGVQNFMDIELYQGSSLGANGSRGGDIRLQGKRVTLADGSRIFAGVEAFTQSSQPSGTLRITALDSVELKGTNSNGDGSALSTSTLGDGNASNIIIDTERLLLQDGALISTESLRVNFSTGQVISAKGSAGDLTVEARKSVEIADNSQITTETSTPGDAGNLRIETGRLIIQDGAQVAVSSLGTEKDAGKTGNIEVVADFILLDNQGKLIATNVVGERGGDIRLKDLNLLLLDRNSEISTNAGTKGSPGDGGNIAINTDTLVGLENSDITANAFQGRGGFIDITAQGVFGLEVRDRLSDGSDITAFSEKDPLLNGVVEINTPDVDPDEGVVALPQQVVDVSRLVAQSCPAGGSAIARGRSDRSSGGAGLRQIAPNQFVATGRGGLPPTPKEALKSDTVLVDLGTPMVSATKSLKPLSTSTRSSGHTAPEEPLHRAKGPTENDANSASGSLTHSAAPTITEAQGWVRDPKGQVVLTAQATTAPHRSGLTSATCHGF